MVALGLAACQKGPTENLDPSTPARSSLNAQRRDTEGAPATHVNAALQLIALRRLHALRVVVAERRRVVSK
jgi:hypothetical protein